MTCLFNNEQSFPFAIPILCYHSWTISGSGYEQNDHAALESDLRILAEKGYKILPLTALVGALRGDIYAKQFRGQKLVCLTCDDGNDFDYYDYSSEEWGSIHSFHSILQKSKAWLPQYLKGPRGVSFVIASLGARNALDNTRKNGFKRFGDEWWSECAEKGILGIANHSWDHVHELVDVVRQRENKKGSFFEISSFEDADAQIADAQEYIQGKTNKMSLPYFGYPYGHVPPYLRDEYFPNNAERLGICAAFSTAGKAVKEDSNIWNIPRFVCGDHWKSPEEFIEMLDIIEAGKANRN